MLTGFCKKLFEGRRASVAIIVAITLVPMMIAGATAIDMARIVAARTVLQAAVDAAAISGGGAYGTSASASAATTAAQATYAGTTATLGSMASNVTPSTATSLVSTYCNTTNGSVSCNGVAADTTGTCPKNGATPAYQYCVVVRASLQVNNILLGYLIPKTQLSVKAIDTVGQASYTVTPGSFSSTYNGSASDINNTYAYVVPTMGSSSDFSSLASVYSTCTGLISDVPDKTTVSSGTPCNYLLIGTSDTSSQGSSTGSLTFSSGQYIGFAYANLVGGNNSYGWVPEYTGLTASKTQNGTTTSSAANAGLCYTGSSSNNGLATGPNCSYTTTTYNWWGQPTTTTYNYPYLHGECPEHNLYGGLSQETANSNMVGFTGVPTADSLTIYSAAYEMLGYPTTHGANHTLPAFSTTQQETVTYNNHNQTYYVTVQCPDWPTTAAGAATDTTADNGSSNTQYSSTEVPVDTDITAFSTYYPDVGYSDSSGSVYPPYLPSSCSPATTYPAASGTTTDAWWGWSRSNITNGNHYCRNQPTTAPATAYNATTNPYDPSYNNCALIIQPLGNGVPTTTTTTNSVTTTAPELPSYYVAVKTSNSNSTAVTPVLLDPIYDHATFTDLYPGVLDNLPTQGINSSISLASGSAAANNSNGTAVTIQDTNATGFYPNGNSGTGSYQITSGAYAGDYAFLETPASNGGNTLNSLPPETSYRCYNPQDNGFSSTQFSGTNNNTGAAVDHIANPQLGAIDCSGLTGYSFGLYWNDLGSTEADDLGYLNAVTVFTCPSPTYSTGSSAPSTLSG